MQLTRAPRPHLRTRQHRRSFGCSWKNSLDVARHRAPAQQVRPAATFPRPLKRRCRTSAACLEEERLRREQERLEAERRRVAQAEAESKRRAAEMQAQRAKEMEAQRAAKEVEQAKAEQVDRFARQKAEAKAQAKDLMRQALAAVHRAVAADEGGNASNAYKEYASAVTQFSTVLGSNTLPHLHDQLVQRMDGYLLRMSDLEPEVCEGDTPVVPKFKGRVSTLMSMARAAPSYDLVGAGDRIRAQVRLDAKNRDRRAEFRHSCQAADFYMARFKLLKERRAPADAALEEALKEMIATAERAKAVM